jgi:hypothetical protein
MAVFTFILAATSGFTIWILKNQLREMHEGGTDTHDLAVAAKTQAEKMKSMSDAADKIRQAAEGMVTQEKRLADNTKTALDATIAQMRTQTRLAVRPWVGLDDEIPQPIQNGPLHIDDTGNATLSYAIQAKNFGNVAASNVISFVFLVVADDAAAVDQKQKEACGENYIGNPEVGLVLFPGKERTFNRSVALGKLNLRHPSGYYIGVWLTGCIGYRDQFGYLYRTKFSATMVDSIGNPVFWAAPPKGVVDVNGALLVQRGSIDSGQATKPWK